jgi:hypothetical protein
VQNFFQWFSANKFYQDKPWLILGKGPSFASIDQYSIEEYLTISLNHVIKQKKVTLAHAIDYDVIESCAREIDINAQYLVLPWYPHFNFRPTNKSLADLIPENNLLKKLSSEGRLLWYNKVTRSIADTDEVYQQDESNLKYPDVPVSYFSAEAVVNLLAIAGVKLIRSLGVDGGVKYSSNFSDLTKKTLLANSQTNFDLQFQSISQTIMKLGLDYAPLGLESPIAIYVGSTDAQLIPVKVLEYSIKKHSTMPVKVFPLYKANIPIPIPKDPKNRPRTPFSFQRFLIPQLKQFKGKAIYLDSDMLVFSDIKKLWAKPFMEADIISAYEAEGSARRPQFAVMVMNCESLRVDISEIVKKLDNGDLNYESLMFDFKIADKVKPIIEAEWNSLEFFEEGKTQLLHYTDMNCQPWIFRNNPLGHLWVKELVKAIKDDFISIDELKREIIKGNLRPSLLYQVKREHYSILNLPKKVRALDKFYTPPHKIDSSTLKANILINKLICKFIINFT